MSCYTIYYQDGAKRMRPVLTAAEYRNLRDTEKQKAMVRGVRLLSRYVTNGKLERIGRGVYRKVGVSHEEKVT